MDKETKNNKRVKTLSCQFLTLPLATARKQTDPVFFIIIYFIFGSAGSSLVYVDFSLVAESGVYSLVAVCGLLVAVAPLVSEHKLQSVGSVVVAHGLSCPTACGILQCPLH